MSIEERLESFGRDGGLRKDSVVGGSVTLLFDIVLGR